MPYNLKGRHFLKLQDFTPKDIAYLLELSKELKDLKNAGIKKKMLEGKNIALIFEKPSTRTRCAFTVACVDEGAHPEYLGKGDLQFGKKESIADTAKVLGRLFDGIQFRGFRHDTVEQLAANAGVPVWNGLTDEYHPTQVLADLLTIQENLGTPKLHGVKLAYVGDGRNNMGNTLLIGAAMMGMDFRIAAPRSLFPQTELVEYAQQVAETTGGKILLTEHVAEAVLGADAIYTDVWVSMGEEEHFEERIHLLRPYQVSMETIRMTGNPEVIFLHCLPAFHDLETAVGREVFEKYGLREMEVTDEVFQSKHSVVFDQAENRLHTIKAVMVATL